MKKIISRLFILMFSVLWMQAVFAEDAPTAMLRSMADRMISQLKSHQATLKSHPSIVFSFAREIVVPNADLDAMAMRVLPARTWTAATPQQRAQFKKEFTTTLIRTYASALAEYNDETVKFFPVRGGVSGGAVKVDSQIIRNDGPAIAMSYSVIQAGGKWKLIDITVEGVSMLQSFRSQFADKLDREDMVALIKDLAQHNTENGG